MQHSRAVSWHTPCCTLAPETAARVALCTHLPEHTYIFVGCFEWCCQCASVHIDTHGYSLHPACRWSESPADGSFLACELYRQVSQAQGQGGVGDYAVISRYQALPQALPRQAQLPGQQSSNAIPTSASQGGVIATSASGESTDSAGASGMGSSQSVAVSSSFGGSGVQRVAVTQRVAAFLTPQDDKFFKSGNKAVALYDYTYTLTRVSD